jgi:cytochrome P450 family 9
MAFMAYEIAVNPDIQKKLRKEIDESESQGKTLTYERMQSMKYLDQVMSETLRRWPAGVLADRSCLKDYEIEYDDKKFTIEKGKTVYIPISGIHLDERFYKNPEKFDPERFSDENKASIDPDTYLPFGECACQTNDSQLLID